MKKILALVLTAVMMFSLTAAAFADDIPGDVNVSVSNNNAAVSAENAETKNVNGNVTATASDDPAKLIEGVEALDGATIKVDGNVKLIGGTTESKEELYPVCAFGEDPANKSEINVTGEVILEFKDNSTNKYCSGIYASTGDVKAGNVSVISGENNTNRDLTGITAVHDSTVIAGNVTVDAGSTGYGNVGIDANDSTVTVGGVTVTGDKYNTGIYAENSDITAGEVTVSGKSSIGVHVVGESDVTVDGISVSGEESQAILPMWDDSIYNVIIISNGDVCANGSESTAIHLDECTGSDDDIQIVIHGDVSSDGETITTDSSHHISDIDSTAVDIYVESITLGEEIGSIIADGVAIGEDGMLEAAGTAGDGNIAFLKEILHYIVDTTNVQLVAGFDQNDNEALGFDYSAKLESEVTFKADDGYELDLATLNENGYENYYTMNADGSCTMTVRYFGNLVFKANMIPVVAATAGDDEGPGYLFTLKKDGNDKSRGQKFAFDYASADSLLYVWFGQTRLVRDEDYTVTEADGKIVVEISESFFAKYQRDAFDIVLIFSDGTMVSVVAEKE